MRYNPSQSHADQQHRSGDKDAPSPRMRSEPGSRRRDNSRGRPVYRREEAVAASGHSSYKSGVLCRVTERVPQPADCCIQAVIKIDEGIRRPKLLLQFLSSDYLARVLEEQS